MSRIFLGCFRFILSDRKWRFWDLVLLAIQGVPWLLSFICSVVDSLFPCQGCLAFFLGQLLQQQQQKALQTLGICKSLLFKVKFCWTCWWGRVINHGRTTCVGDDIFSCTLKMTDSHISVTWSIFGDTCSQLLISGQLSCIYICSHSWFMQETAVLETGTRLGSRLPQKLQHVTNLDTFHSKKCVAQLLA